MYGIRETNEKELYLEMYGILETNERVISGNVWHMKDKRLITVLHKHNLILSWQKQSRAYNCVVASCMSIPLVYLTNFDPL